jgi:hypothetical protein
LSAVLRPATYQDIEHIVANARPADVAEMKILGTTVEQAMKDGIERSDWACTGTWNGEPVCMFGVAPIHLLCGLGAPWMIGTSKLETIEKAFLRRCRNVVSVMKDTYPNLANIVDAENTRAIQWLTWLGFEFPEGEYYLGPHKMKLFKIGDL